MNSIHSWLATAKRQVTDADLIVVGNEAADLDSIVSSIIYGYLRSLLEPQRVVVSILNIPRADLNLRLDAVYLFHEAGIKVEDLVFRDEVAVDALAERAHLVLVDHNRPSACFASFQVTGILDHHHDEGMYPLTDPHLIEPVGSTATLVGREFLASGLPVDQDFALLLVGTILLDTVNLEERAGRVTDTDRKVAERLLPLIQQDRQQLFTVIRQAKFNLLGLSTHDLLRRDYKEYSFAHLRCGISSVPLSMHSWWARDTNLLLGMEEFAAQKGVDIFFSMNNSATPVFTRELTILWSDVKGERELCNWLSKNGLVLLPLDLPENVQSRSGFRMYQQRNVKFSRKKLQPLLMEFFKQYCLVRTAHPTRMP